MNERARDKLTVSVTIKCDAKLAAEIERVQQARERALGLPLSRSLVVRLLLEECLGIREPATRTHARE